MTTKSQEQLAEIITDSGLLSSVSAILNAELSANEAASAVTISEHSAQYIALKASTDAKIAELTAQVDSLNAARDEDHARSVGYVDAAKAHLQGLFTVLSQASMKTEELRAAQEAEQIAKRKAELEAELAKITG